MSHQESQELPDINLRELVLEFLVRFIVWLPIV